MTQSRKQPANENETPGADRFWGQVSQTGRGREDDPRPEADPDTDPDPDRSTAAEGSTEQETAKDGPAPDQADGHPGGHGDCLEWCPICRSAELIRNAVTPELREQAESLQREAFSVFQAFMNSYADKTGGNGQKKQQAPGEENSKPGPGAGKDEEPGITEIPLD